MSTRMEGKKSTHRGVHGLGACDSSVAPHSARVPALWLRTRMYHKRPNHSPESEMPLRRINAAAGMDVATFKKRLAQCKVGSEYLGPDTYGGAQVTSAEAFMNICLLRDENLSDAQRRALNELTSVEMGFSIDQTYYGSTDSPDSNKYHGAVLELQMEANRIAKCLQRAKRAAKDEAAGLNHLIEERKRELKAEIKFKEKDLEQLKGQVKDQPSKRSRVMQGTTASGAPYYKASVTK